MKAMAAALAMGLAALVLQGALARVVSPPWCPDFAWLVVVALGLRWPHWLSGLCVAVVLGYAMDLVSGSLMGQHALMRLLTFLAAAIAARQLDLSGAIPVAIFVFLTTLLYGLATVGILSFFVGSEGFGWFSAADAFGHALANVVAAGPVLAWVERVLLRLSEEESGRRAPFNAGLPGGGFG